MKKNVNGIEVEMTAEEIAELEAERAKETNIIAQEKVYPFAYCTYKLSDELIEEGRKEYQMLLNKFKSLNDGINFNHYNNGKVYEV